jgi:pyruvate dehydrogenase E2 component (dihydrolipoamide acetyltransferase)
MSEKDSVYQVVMPRLGLTMTEGKIIEWVKADGDWAQKGETLFIIENEKSTVEIEAPADGYLKILIAVDVTVPILSPVGTLSGGTVSGHHAISGGEQSAESAPVADSAAPKLNLPEAESGVRASPKARALARKLNIPLEGISGTGIRDMVVAEDVQRAAKSTVKASPVAQRVAEEAGVDLASVAGSGSGGRIMRGDVERALHKQQSAPLPLSGLRGIIAERLSQSWRERPQVTLTTDADATNLVAARQQLNAELASTGEKISYNALLIKLVAQALHEQPNINVQLTASGLQTMSEINIGLAVDTERGLLVPVVRDPLQKSLRQINADMLALAERAVKGRSHPDDLSGGTFSVTNLGAYEIDAFTPLVNPPECAILGVGRIVSKPVGLNGQIVLRDMLALSLSFDHRLVDGAPAAKFLQRVKQLIERPFTLAL